MIYDVVVVGAGFSSIATVCNLLDQLTPSATVAVIGDDPGYGRGTAYRTELYLHRLNVPAGRMSMFVDRPDAFVEWLRDHKRPLAQGDYASRQDYGLYVRDTLAGLLRSKRDHCRVDFVKAKATGCVERYDSVLGFLLDNGDEIAGRNVVLCLGVGSAQLPADLADLSSSAKRHVIENPWRLSWLHRVEPQDRVCILGSGLTMIDQVLALQARGFRGHIDVLSRRGLAPLGHKRKPMPPAAVDVGALPKSIAGILHALRAIARHEEDWRNVMDGLRPQTQALWQGLSQAERRRFLRHALPWWNIHRHRVAPDVFERFRGLVRAGQVEFHAGFLKTVREAPAMSLCYRVRGSGETRTLQADWIVNCTGMERSGISHSPLLREMERQKLIRPDPLRLGIDVDARSRSQARPELRTPIYVVGALSAGQFWEITAVPDIRLQARAVAEAIATAGPD